MSWMDGLSLGQFHGFHLNNIAIFEVLLLLNIFLYGIHIVEGTIIGELAGQIVQKLVSAVRLLTYNNHMLRKQH